MGIDGRSNLEQKPCSIFRYTLGEPFTFWLQTWFNDTSEREQKQMTLFSTILLQTLKGSSKGCRGVCGTWGSKTRMYDFPSSPGFSVMTASLCAWYRKNIACVMSFHVPKNKTKCKNRSVDLLFPYGDLDHSINQVELNTAGFVLKQRQAMVLLSSCTLYKNLHFPIQVLSCRVPIQVLQHANIRPILLNIRWKT